MEMKQQKSLGKLFVPGLIRKVKSLIFASPLIFMSPLSTYFGGPIKSQNQLDSLIVAESNKLGINPKNILGEFGECPTPSGMPYNKNPRSSSVSKIDDFNFKIILDRIRTKNSLRYELYHIYNNDFENQKNGYNFFELLIDELQANLYSSTGIKTSLQ